MSSTEIEVAQSLPPVEVGTGEVSVLEGAQPEVPAPEKTHNEAARDPPNLQVIVGDNSSTQPSLIPSSPKLEGEVLREALLKQVEYYFSRQNLSNDAYLVSQMNSELFVPISTIANFKMVKALTEDVELIRSVLKQSKTIVLDPSSQMVRPNFQNKRSTLILRDISSATNPEEVKAIFEGDHASKIKGIRSDIGDTWFVTFDDEDAALSALEYSRSRTFHGQPVKARIKSENLVRNFYLPGMDPMGGAPSPVSPAVASPKFYPPAMSAVPMYNAPPSWTRPAPMPYVPYPHANGDPGYWRPEYKGYPPVMPTEAAQAGPYQRTPPSQYNNVASPNTNQAAPPNPSSPKPKRGKSGAQNRRRTIPDLQETITASMGAPAALKSPATPLALTNFPPLPSRPKSSKLRYDKDFNKYTKDDMVKAFETVTVDLSKPECLAADCIVVLSEPRLQLESSKPWPIVTDADEDDYEQERERRGSRGRSGSTSYTQGQPHGAPHVQPHGHAQQKPYRPQPHPTQQSTSQPPPAKDGDGPVENGLDAGKAGHGKVAKGSTGAGGVASNPNGGQHHLNQKKTKSYADAAKLSNQGTPIPPQGGSLSPAKTASAGKPEDGKAEVDGHAKGTKAHKKGHKPHKAAQPAARQQAQHPTKLPPATSSPPSAPALDPTNQTAPAPPAVRDHSPAPPAATPAPAIPSPAMSSEPIAAT